MVTHFTRRCEPCESAEFGGCAGTRTGVTIGGARLAGRPSWPYASLWGGYNGQTPRPTIEAVEGNKVRIFVTNRLPEHTTVHWHGMLLPNGMDGVGGLTQPHIQVDQTFVTSSS